MSKLPVNGVNLYYELHGPADADVLVLNNGILMSAANSWGFQTPTLARRRVQHRRIGLYRETDLTGFPAKT